MIQEMMRLQGLGQWCATYGGTDVKSCIKFAGCTFDSGRRLNVVDSIVTSVATSLVTTKFATTTPAAAAAGAAATVSWSAGQRAGRHLRPGHQRFF